MSVNRNIEQPTIFLRSSCNKLSLSAFLLNIECVCILISLQTFSMLIESKFICCLPFLLVYCSWTVVKDKSGD